MNIFELKKFQKIYHQWSDHVASCDFMKAPDSFKKDVEVGKIPTLSRLDLDEKRVLMINESADPKWEKIREFLCGLDALPDVVLRDMYDLLIQKCGKNITIKNFEDADRKKAARNLVLICLPEILWCKGDDHIKTRIFVF